MDVFLTPDKIPARPVLKEIHSNDMMNNKSPASRNAADESNGSLGEFAKITPNTNSKSIALPETPHDRNGNGQVNEADSTCDDLIRNINALALNTPQRPKPTNAQIENCNSPSSDDEVFQECENTFDGTQNAKIVSESGYRTANYSNDTLDATINFTANIANSTTTSAAANLTDRFAILSQKSSGFSSHLEATRNLSENGQTIDSLPTEYSVGTLDRTIPSNIDSIESSGISVGNLPSIPLDSANGTLTIESDAETSNLDIVAEEASIEHPFRAPDVLHGTVMVDQPSETVEIEKSGTDMMAQPEQSFQNIENLESNATFENGNDSGDINPNYFAEETHPVSQHEASADPDLQESAVNELDSTQTISNETQNVAEALDIVGQSTPVIAEAATVTETVEVAQPTEPEVESSIGDTTVNIESEVNEPMDVSMGMNGTFSEPPEPMDVSMAMEPTTQIPDHAPPTSFLSETQLLASPVGTNNGPRSTQSDETALLSETQLLASSAPAVNIDQSAQLNEPLPSAVNEPVQSPVNDNTFEPNATIVLNTNTAKIADETRILADATFCAPQMPEETTLRPSANLNETILVDSKLPNPNTTFFAQPSLDVVDETFIQTTNCPANEATFQVACQPKRISFNMDATVSSPSTDQTIDLTETSPLVSNVDEVFKMPSAPIGSFGGAKLATQSTFDISDDEFQSGGMILNPSDFEFLLSKGETPKRNVCRDSILERFDPLSSRKSVIQSIPIGPRLPQTREENRQQPQQQQQQQQQQAPEVVANQQQKSKSAIEIDVSLPTPTNATIVKLDSPELSFEKICAASDTSTSSSSDTYVTASLENLKPKAGNAKMSVGLIHDMNNENMKSMEQVDIHDEPNLKMNDEKNVKHDFVEDIQRKLKDAEAREESLIRRITEKDKAMNKMSAVMENYEKTMVEMITEREQTTQNYEKQMIQLKAECDANFHHLTSLENTFSDLHAKYEKSKQLTLEIKENETKLLEKLEFAQQQMKLQEQRYDKLKNHAFTQLENANAKLEALTKSHSNEIKKLSAQLKKEEISRQSIMEQLAQKTKENEELVKICDELINNGPDGS